MPVATVICVKGCQQLDVPREWAVLICPTCGELQLATKRRQTDEHGETIEEWITLVPAHGV